MQIFDVLWLLLIQSVNLKQRRVVNTTFPNDLTCSYLLEILIKDWWFPPPCSASGGCWERLKYISLLSWCDSGGCESCELVDWNPGLKWPWAIKTWSYKVWSLHSPGFKWACCHCTEVSIDMSTLWNDSASASLHLDRTVTRSCSTSYITWYNLG